MSGHHSWDDIRGSLTNDWTDDDWRRHSEQMEMLSQRVNGYDLWLGGFIAAAVNEVLTLPDGTMCSTECAPCSGLVDLDYRPEATEALRAYVRHSGSDGSWDWWDYERDTMRWELVEARIEVVPVQGDVSEDGEVGLDSEPGDGGMGPLDMHAPKPGSLGEDE